MDVVQNYPCLYNASQATFKRRDIKSEACEAVKDVTPLQCLPSPVLFEQIASRVSDLLDQTDILQEMVLPVYHQSMLHIVVLAGIRLEPMTFQLEDKDDICRF